MPCQALTILYRRYTSLSKLVFPSKPDATRFTRRINELRQGLIQSDPRVLAKNTGSRFTPLGIGSELQGKYTLSLWDREIELSYPDYIAHPVSTGEELDDLQQALLLYYFTNADDTPLSGSWISFAELSGGRFYAQAFQGYTGHELARAFQNDLSGFERAATSLGGIRQTLGDASFAYLALPRAPLLVIFWQGDEDFTSTCQVLFDASANHYLPTDAYAILGSTIVHRLIAAMQKV